MQTAVQKSSALHTAAAIFAALVVWVVVDMVATMILVSLDLITTIVRPQIIGFIDNIVGAAAAVAAAGVAVDHWVPRYSRKAVALAFFIASAITLSAEWLLLSDPAHPYMVTAGLVTTVLVAYETFWRRL